MTQAARSPDVWMDAFFASYSRHRPVNATFIGVHDFDGWLPDLSESGVGDLLADTRWLLERLERVEEPRTPAARMDLRLARGHLRIQEWELESAHFQAGNPSFHTGEAAFGVIGLFLTPFAPAAERVEAATARLSGIGRLLEQGRAIRSAPAAWTERAVRECEGAIALFTGGIDALIASGFETGPTGDGDDGPAPTGGPVSASSVDALRKAADAAAAAVAEHRVWLTTELQGRPSEQYACGPEAFDLHLREGHALQQSASEIVRYAEEELAKARDALERGAPDLDADTPEEALARLAELHPDADGYLARYGELWAEVRRAAEAQGVISWPDFPIRYVERPHWVREAAPHLYFLFYRSPAAFDRPEPHHYLVAPLPPGDREAFLRANNDSVIKLNHVVHHGGLGHHVQNWHAFRAESRIGRIAAVDCASRIALFCGGTMAEGWACYATDLAGELGVLTPLERYAELHGRTRMACRAIVDVKLHHGELTLDGAAAFYREHAGMSEAAARGEAVKNSMFPGAALMYLIGTDAIHRLRREQAERMGSSFDLRDFHDTFLSFGSIPVSLIAERMTESFIDAE